MKTVGKNPCSNICELQLPLAVHFACQTCFFRLTLDRYEHNCEIILLFFLGQSSFLMLQHAAVLHFLRPNDLLKPS